MPNAQCLMPAGFEPLVLIEHTQRIYNLTQITRDNGIELVP